MTQEELRNQAVTYISDNLDLESQLQVALEILENLSNTWYTEGYTKESNVVTTCYLQLKELYENKK